MRDDLLVRNGYVKVSGITRRKVAHKIGTPGVYKPVPICVVRNLNGRQQNLPSLKRCCFIDLVDGVICYLESRCNSVILASKVIKSHAKETRQPVRYKTTA